MELATQPIDVKKIAVIGAGSMGWQLAARAAQAGFLVVLEDVLPSNLRRAENGIRESLMAMAQSSNANTASANAMALDAAMARITFVSTVEDAVREADLALDCLPDELESKLEIFSMLDRMAPPHTILCTPTRTLSIADMASCTYRAERCVAARPVQAETGVGVDSLAAAEEIYLMYSHWTLPNVLEAVSVVWQRLGKSVRVEYDGSFAPKTTPDSLAPQSIKCRD